MMELNRAERTVRITGMELFERISQFRVLVCGVGGVGGYAAEHLVRSGVEKLTLVDGDVVDISNINRQIAALDSTVGRGKCEVLKARFLEINPGADIVCSNSFLKTRSDVDLLLNEKFDFVIDAIDDVPAKIELIAACVEKNIPLISSMGRFSDRRR